MGGGGDGAIKTVIFCREIKNGRKNPIKQGGLLKPFV